MAKQLFFYLVFIGLCFGNVSGLNAQTDDMKYMPDKGKTVDTTKRAKPESALGEYHQAYYNLLFLNKGLKNPKNINLETPRAVLEHFILSCRQKDFKSASHALNLNLLPQQVQPTEATILAKKLYYVITKKIKIDWDALPDRPDGLIYKPGRSAATLNGVPRRSIGFGSLSFYDREIDLSIQRVKVENQPPIWVISANTVENIDLLYKKYGPNDIERLVPDWANVNILGLPIWKILAVILLAIACFFIGKLVRNIVRRTTSKYDKNWVLEISNKVSVPAGLAVGVFIFYFVMNNILSISGSFSPYFYTLLLIIVIGSVTWLIMRSIDYVMDRFIENQVGDISDEENLQSRRILTYISVGRKVITFIVIIVGLSVVVSQFQSLQNLGVSLMASAGLATIILGIAAQSTLGNIIAGLQIAITKPARIGDSVIYDGEYGVIEDIQFTYLIVKTWDERRIIVPLTYFITHPFENWSMNSPHLIKPISIYTDYRIDVEKVRQKFKELVKQAETYDEEFPPKVQVVSSNEEVMQIRALCSAKDANTAWDLHCDLREKLIKYVAELEGGIHLAKTRVVLQQDNS